VFSKLDLIPKEEQEAVIERAKSHFKRNEIATACEQEVDCFESKARNDLAMTGKFRNDSCIAISSVANWNLQQLKETLYRIINDKP
jgi:hypothetical protein